ncbi:MAG: serine hydrolase [Bacteroidota bacterium]
MKTILLLITVFTLTFSKAQSLYFPPITGTTWETTDPLSLGYCQENIDNLYDYLDDTHSKAFILLQDGKIVFEKYFGTFTKDSLHVWNSAGKTLTAMAVGIAQKEGFLDIHDTTSQYLGQGWTSLNPQQEEKITILNQLTMTSGLGYAAGTDHYCTDPACLVYLADPNTRWSYHNGPYTLLDGVIEAATGVNLNTYVSQKIKSQIGMNGAFVQVDYNNIFISNARSMARYGLLLLGGGTWNGTPILDDAAYFQAMTNSSQNLNPSYGYLTWLNGKSSWMVPSADVQVSIPGSAMPNAPDDTYAAMGKNGQFINVVPSQNLVFIRMGDADGTSLVGNQYCDTIWQKINALACTGNTLEINQDEKIRLYPNPSKDFLAIQSDKEILKYKISDMNGKLYVLPFKNNKSDSYRIEIGNLEKGIYFIELFYENEIKCLKFVKE